MEVIIEGYLISKETKKENFTFLYFASRMLDFSATKLLYLAF